MIAVLSVSVIVGSGLGFPISAFVANFWGLAGGYAFGAMLTAATLTLAVLFFPDSSTSSPAAIDGTGVALLATATATALLAVSLGNRAGWLSPEVTGLAVTSLILTVCWVRWTLRAHNPVVDLRLALGSDLLPINLTAISGG